jgi:hypothetical protein
MNISITPKKFVSDVFGMMEMMVKEAVLAEREACADIADRLPRIYRETEEAHYRLSPEPFKPSQFGFDYAELRQAEAITHAIRARG